MLESCRKLFFKYFLSDQIAFLGQTLWVIPSTLYILWYSKSAEAISKGSMKTLKTTDWSDKSATTTTKVMSLSELVS